MVKAKYLIPFLLVIFINRLSAQENHSFEIYRTYHAAVDLFDKGAFVAAAEQFRLVEKSRDKTSKQPEFESQLSLIKENCQYYEAVCALELGNDDAESMLL